MAMAVSYIFNAYGLNHVKSARLFHACKTLAAVDKGSLAKLRKKTGFTIGNCKKALEINGNDIKKAEEWLIAQAQAQGWAKASKLAGRSTTQGLIGVHVEGNTGVVVEVNCETDFVARNEKFQSLVSTIAKEIAKTKSSPSNEYILKEGISGEQLKNMTASDGKSLGDLVALTIGNVGENMTPARAVRMIVPPELQLVGYVHPSANDQGPKLGKFGAMMALKTNEPLTDLARQLCVQVIGMNPKSVGKSDDPKSDNPEEEPLLYHQEFLSEPSMTVGEVMNRENVQVIDFVRFGCGETQED
ncbi:unnamed protein product [Meganyctiphanes norvegica]|uniref:Elongation factor Ts, mitochondrial n=1 Tax=Meganyctiphanes norvegica TaxID=48144 RepID=A0AAV2PMI6_MEGNR